jgi:hypothetical protein
MTRDELIALRSKTVERVEKLRRLGDHSAEAPDIRANAEDILHLQDHLLERMKR